MKTTPQKTYHLKITIYSKHGEIGTCKLETKYRFLKQKIWAFQRYMGESVDSGTVVPGKRKILDFFLP